MAPREERHVNFLQEVPIFIETLHVILRLGLIVMSAFFIALPSLFCTGFER